VSLLGTMLRAPCHRQAATWGACASLIKNLSKFLAQRRLPHEALIGFKFRRLPHEALIGFKSRLRNAHHQDAYIPALSSRHRICIFTQPGSWRARAPSSPGASLYRARSNQVSCSLPLAFIGVAREGPFCVCIIMTREDAISDWPPKRGQCGLRRGAPLQDEAEPVLLLAVLARSYGFAHAWRR
jgi:hypothetical protein